MGKVFQFDILLHQNKSWTLTVLECLLCHLLCKQGVKQQLGFAGIVVSLLCRACSDCSSNAAPCLQMSALTVQIHYICVFTDSR